MKRIHSFQFDNVTQYQIQLPPGWYKGLMLSFEGSNKAAQTATLANLGDIRLYRDGKRIWEITIEKLYYFVQQNFPGAQQFASAVGAAVACSVYIPLHFNGDNNVCRLGGNYTLEFSHADLAAVLATTTCTVLAQPGIGAEKYFPLYNNFSIRSLSQLTEPEKFNRRNLAFVAVDYSANHTHFRLKKGENYIYDMTDEESDFVTNIETQVVTYAATAATIPVIMSLYKDRNLVQVAGQNDVAFGVVSSDTNTTGLTVEFELNAAKLAHSNDIVNKVAREKAQTPAELTNLLAA